MKGSIAAGERSGLTLRLGGSAVSKAFRALWFDRSLVCLTIPQHRLKCKRSHVNSKYKSVTFLKAQPCVRLALHMYSRLCCCNGSPTPVFLWVQQAFNLSHSVSLMDARGSLGLLRVSDCNYTTRRAGKVQLSLTIEGKETMREKQLRWSFVKESSSPLVPLCERQCWQDWWHHEDLFLNSACHYLAYWEDQPEPGRGQQDASRKRGHGRSSSQTARRSLWIKSKGLHFHVLTNCTAWCCRNVTLSKLWHLKMSWCLNAFQIISLLQSLTVTHTSKWPVR